VCSAWRRATSDTDPPGASTSARIASFCSRRHRRRVLAIISNRGEVLSPDIVPSYLPDQSEQLGAIDPKGTRRPSPDAYDTWSIRADQLCREWTKLEPRQRCLAAASAGSKIQLFDHMGLMLIEARVVDE
jgi:hypothetical protein